MKTQPFFQSMTEKLTHWRGRYKALCHKGHLLGTRGVINNILLDLSKKSDKCDQQKLRVSRSMAAYKTNRGTCIRRLGYIPRRTPVIFAIALVSLTGVMGHKLYNQPKLKAGTIAPQTMKAPYSANIEDKEKTEQERKAATKSSLLVLMVDAEINEQIHQDLQKLLDLGNEIRATAGYFPFFDTLVLPLSTQRYLRSCSNSEWQMLLSAIANTNKQPKFALKTQKHSAKIVIIKTGDLQGQKNIMPIQTVGAKVDNFSQKTDFAQAVAELQTYRLRTSQQNLSSVTAQISQARKAYAQANAKLLQLNAANRERVYYDTSFLNLSDDDWGKTETGIRQIAERILAQGIPPGLPQKILQDAVRLQVQTSVPQEVEPLATKLLLAVLKANLKKDEEQTKQNGAQAAAGVKPVMVPMRQGEVIVKKGEMITAWDFEVLEHYHLVRRELNWRALMQLGGFVSGSIGIFALVEGRIKTKMRQRDRLLILLLTIGVPGVLIGTPYTTWSAIGLLLGSFYGANLGITVIGLLALQLPFSLEMSRTVLWSGAAGGILGCCIAKRLRSREELALLSVAVALTQGGVYLICKLLLGAAFGSGWYIVLGEAGFFALSGLVWSIVALGLSPYLEKLFDLVTPIRLAELANPNRTLLKQLATKTPGTFQHTLFVATLAEAAAKHLKCNVELVRAGTLYHDIGKMHDPLGFIENQMGGPNKHDTEINDPWKSAKIIKKHVSEGLVMARKHSLPTAIQAFIPEHQGTMLIAYFYHQAQQMAKENPNLKVNEADFRYDGPIPQSRETAIVMLADSCEAALRSLKDVSPEQALAMLNNILRARWQDNQLLDSGLTREEMSQIAEIFVEVWQQFHHKRIAYPKLKPCN
ncbi:MAG: HD family phosphohydrolase [Spirirestis rafaelensis WJT71-NPBG6]|jgi:putative nucleotidyltransferase with HDIG domain|nr:HD family phosphohydrolase [Spirirestis rafaelensis WJT71-NPBG6]